MKTEGTKDVAASLQWPLRPVLTSLNGDHSWLFSFPRPEKDGHHQHFYHVAFEPWLFGGTTEIAEWLVHLSLEKDAAIPSGDAVQEVATDIERIAARLAEAHGSGTRPVQEKRGDEYIGPIDAIAVLFDGPDHLHRKSLETFDKRIPLVASKEASDKIKAWSYFESISVIADWDNSAETWQSMRPPSSPLPSWLTTFKIPGEGILNFVGVFIWSHTLPSGEEVHEAILESPHGTQTLESETSGIQTFLRMTPAFKPLALLHGLKESFTTRWWRTTHGAEAGLKLYRKSGSNYWILSHNSALGYNGLVMWSMVWDVKRTLDWALGREEEATKSADVNFVDVGNGNSFVLV
ncbi:unnamed protein product [Clonostachys rosea]|uniref:Uncharacterized protein n=1 Tax=Bionectria ochroleuca TaxID=29856 RepID=A0ABY6U643_BIOOC|nr:unnamed protein product [Clonostachys rosea]